MSSQKPISLFCRQSISRPLSQFIASAIAACLISIIGPHAVAQLTTAQATVPQSVATLPPGTKATSSQQSGRWNRVLLLATPKINSGDIGKLSSTIRQAATGLTLTIMATVQSTQDESRFELRELGVGYSVPIAGQQTVITSATQSAMGANLGFIQKRVLATNEQQLADVQSIVQTTTLAIFDAPAIMYRDDKHRDYTTRHLVWVDAKTGTNAMMVWLLGKDANGKLRPANEPLRVVVAETKEQRNVHVDGGEFTLGFPSSRAFALEDLPPGADVAWTNELATVAALPSYNPQTLAKLSTAINAAINASKQK